ncbi:MAG TPA: M1 family aminopeptidase [Longimicrobium sp.]|nr:M1 family aminopeptidase [Longimicrobium sp.]
MRTRLRWCTAALLAVATSIHPLPAQAPASSTLARYELDVEVLPSVRGLRVTGRLELPAVTVPRDTVTLLLSSWMEQVRIAPAGSDARLETDGADGDRSWHVIPPAPFPAGVPVVLDFSCSADSLTAAQLRVDSASALAGGGGEIWYPRLAFDSLATGVLTIHAPAGQTVLATGEPIGDESERQRGIFRTRIGWPRGHFAFISAPFTVTRAAAGDTHVALYSIRQRPGQAEMAMRVARVLETLSRRYGSIPFREYAVAEAPFGGSVGGTSEHGFFLATPGAFDQGLPVPFIGHEIAHLWWGNLVRTSAGPGRMLLTEGNASYAMAAVMEALEGDSAHRALRLGMYPGEALRSSPEGYFRLAAAGLEMPLASVVPRGQFELLRMHRMANTRGAFVLGMLGREVGPERLDRILREIVLRYAGSAIGWSEFRGHIEREIRRETGRDVGWFFDQWFERPGAPELTVDWQPTTGGVAGAVLQHDTPYRATLDLEFRGARGERARRSVAVEGARTPFSFPLPFTAESVLIDPDYFVLRWTPEIRARATAFAGATAVEWHRSFGSRDSAIAIYRRHADAQPDTFGAQFRLHYQGGLALLASADSTAAEQAFQRALEEPVRDPELLPWAYLSLARLLHDPVERRRAATAALTADARLGGTSGVAPEARRVLAAPSPDPGN